jgi:hypothetical protein
VLNVAILMLSCLVTEYCLVTCSVTEYCDNLYATSSESSICEHCDNLYAASSESSICEHCDNMLSSPDNLYAEQNLMLSVCLMFH